MSPDERWLAGGRADASGGQGRPGDIFIRSLTGDREARLTFDDAVDSLPVWSPDGKRIAFTSNRSGTFSIYVATIDRPGAEELLLETAGTATVAQDWSPVGRFLLIYETRPRCARQ